MCSTFYVFLNNYLKVSRRRFIFPLNVSSRFVYSSRDTLNDIRGNQWYFLLQQMFLFSPHPLPKWTSSKDFLTSGYVFLRIVSCRLHPLHSHGPVLLEPVGSIAPNSLWQRNRWRVFAKSSLHHRQRLATQRISDRTRVDCTNVVAVAAAIADAVDENEYPLDGRAVGVTREICR